jgi:uncharacterized protein DUF1566
VWEQSPLAPCLNPLLCIITLDTGTRTWLDAQGHCDDLTLGNRKGWRLPTVQELASLVDPTVPFPGPTLPVGHPFTNVQTRVLLMGGDTFANYWSATTNARDAGFAWVVTFNFGLVSADFKSVPNFVWCVRGGHGVDPQ